MKMFCKCHGTDKKKKIKINKRSLINVKSLISKIAKVKISKSTKKGKIGKSLVNITQYDKN